MPKYIPTGWAKWVVTWCGTTRSRQRTRWRRSPCSQHRGTRRRTAAPLPWKYPKCSEHSAHIRWRSMKWAGTVLRSSTWYVLEFLRRFRYCYGILFKFSFFSFSPCPFSQSSFRTDSYSNEYFLAKFGVDTEENEPYKVCSFGWKIR